VEREGGQIGFLHLPKKGKGRGKGSDTPFIFKEEGVGKRGRAAGKRNFPPEEIRKKKWHIIERRGGGGSKTEGKRNLPSPGKERGKECVSGEARD